MPKPLGHKGTWTTQSLTLRWFVTLLPPFWNPSPLARATFNQGPRGASTQANPGYRCHQCNGPCGDRTRVADSRVQRLNHWAIKVPERPSRLCLTVSEYSLHLIHYTTIICVLMDVKLCILYSCVFADLWPLWPLWPVTKWQAFVTTVYHCDRSQNTTPIQTA